MSEHKATIKWKMNGPDFLKGRYSRRHTWTFDGGVTVPASAAPGNAPVAFVNAAGVDPEEAYVASISSCHMLTFLYVAQKQGFLIERYEDEAIGIMSKSDKGIPWVSTVTLHPVVDFKGPKLPTPADEANLHQMAHEQCFIANSVKTEIKFA